MIDPEEESKTAATHKSESSHSSKSSSGRGGGKSISFSMSTTTAGYSVSMSAPNSSVLAKRTRPAYDCVQTLSSESSGVGTDDIRLTYAQRFFTSFNGSQREELVQQLRSLCAEDVAMSIKWIGERGNLQNKLNLYLTLLLAFHFFLFRVKFINFLFVSASVYLFYRQSMRPKFC
jgi:hypothetical protein